MEQGVTRKDDLVAVVLHEPADAVLRVAWRVETLDVDIANLEALAVTGRLGHCFAVLAADYGELGQAQFRQLETEVSEHLTVLQVALRHPPVSCCLPHGPSGLVM